MSHNITVEGGKAIRLKTSGKYCDQDIIVTATGGDEGYEEGYKAGVESFSAVEDGLLSKTLTEYHNMRPVTIGNRFFSYFYNLVLVDIPNAVSIQQYAFEYCTALEEIVLPSATDIQHYVFQNCSKLTKVDLYVAENLASNVLSNTNLTTLILRKTNSITRNSSTASISNTPIARGEGYVYVPAALIDAYKVATNWSAYADRFRAIEDYPEICGV